MKKALRIFYPQGLRIFMFVFNMILVSLQSIHYTSSPS